MLNACGQKHDRLRQHRQAAVRSRARRPRSRCAHGRSEFVSARNDHDVSSVDQRLAEFRARSSRSLPLVRRISRGQAAHFRKSNRRRRRGGQCGRRTCRRSQRATVTFSAYDDRRRFSSRRRRDRLSRRTGFASGRNETARLAQHREPDGDARGRTGARLVLRANGAAACATTSRARIGCEFVREVGGVDYINDSKATNLDAVEKALLAQTKPIVLDRRRQRQRLRIRLARDHSLGKKFARPILIGEMARTHLPRLERGRAVRDRDFHRRRGRARARRRAIRRGRPLFSRHFVFRHVQKLRRSRRPISCPGARAAKNEP